MPKHLAADRRAFVIADVIRRLEEMILSISRAYPNRADSVAATVRGLAATREPVDGDAPAQVHSAAAQLTSARAALDSRMQVAVWVERFCDPMCRERLPGLTIPWTRATNLLRDKERRQRLASPNSSVVKARLGKVHHRMLAELRLARPDLSVADLVQQGVSRQHQALRQQSRKAAVSGPGLFDKPAE